MNVSLEMDQELLQEAIDLLEEVRIHYEVEASALSRMEDVPAARALALKRMRAAKLAGKLVLFFAQK